MIERAQAMEVETYVPGHGFVDSPEVLREELEVFRQAVVQVIEEGRRLHGQGLSLEEARTSADFGELGDWWLSESQAGRAIQQVYAELDGTLPPMEGEEDEAEEGREGGEEPHRVLAAERQGLVPADGFLRTLQRAGDDEAADGLAFDGRSLLDLQLCRSAQAQIDSFASGRVRRSHASILVQLQICTSLWCQMQDCTALDCSGFARHIPLTFGSMR